MRVSLNVFPPPGHVTPPPALPLNSISLSVTIMYAQFGFVSRRQCWTWAIWFDAVHHRSPVGGTHQTIGSKWIRITLKALEVRTKYDSVLCSGRGLWRTLSVCPSALQSCIVFSPCLSRKTYAKSAHVRQLCSFWRRAAIDSAGAATDDKKTPTVSNFLVNFGCCQAPPFICSFSLIRLQSNRVNIPTVPFVQQQNVYPTDQQTVSYRRIVNTTDTGIVTSHRYY